MARSPGRRRDETPSASCGSVNEVFAGDNIKRPDSVTTVRQPASGRAVCSSQSDDLIHRSRQAGWGLACCWSARLSRRPASPIRTRRMGSARDVGPEDGAGETSPGRVVRCGNLGLSVRRRSGRRRRRRERRRPSGGNASSALVLDRGWSLRSSPGESLGPRWGRLCRGRRGSRGLAAQGASRSPSPAQRAGKDRP